MNQWRVFLFGEDITTRVSGVSIRWDADNIAGECTVEVADRRYILPDSAPVRPGATGLNGRHNLVDLDFRALRVRRLLPVRVEEWVPSHYGSEYYSPEEWVQGVLVPGEWVGGESVPDQWVVRGEFFLEKIGYGEEIDKMTATLWGRSKSALLAAPFAGKISRQWDKITGTTTIMQEVAAPYGVDVRCPPDPLGQDDYDASIDPPPRGYPVCAGCYAVDHKTPADIVRELMDMAGHRTAPWSDGSVRPWLREGSPVHYIDRDFSPYIIRNLSIDPPDFGARILIASERRPERRDITIKTLTADEEIVPADGTSTARLLATIQGEDGGYTTLAEGEQLLWAATDGSVPAQGETASHGYVVERVVATQFDRATLRHPAKNVAAVYVNENHVPRGFGPGHPPVASYPADTSDRNVLVSLGGHVTGNMITFDTRLPYYDQTLWVLYEPDGYPNTWTAGTRQGPVHVTATVAASQGACTIQQGVPGRGNSLTIIGAESLCYGSGPVTIAVVGRVSGAPATGQVELAVEGCGALSAAVASFGQNSVTETLVVEESAL